MEVDLVRRSVAEFIGAFALTFVGAGAIMVVGGQDIVAVALAHGLAIAVFVSAVGHISGGHFNPAITLGFLVTGRMKVSLAVAYWIAQLGGACCAALLDWWIFPGSVVDGAHLGAPALNSQIGSGAGFVLELILTFFLVFVVFATAADPRGTFKSIAGLAIGLTITLGVLMAGPLTGAAMNPSRAFGPELVNNFWTSDTWIWYAGPFLGGAAAALVYDLLYLRRHAVTPVGAPESGLDEPRPGDTAVS